MKNSKYSLMYRDFVVADIDISEQTVEIRHPSMLPYSVPEGRGFSWGDFRTFCSSRMLMADRKYCKEILDACEIEDQSDVSICIISKGLSFRDNYWIRDVRSDLHWQDVNLYENAFSEDIAYTALTGEIKTIHIGDKIYTGELTNRGTKAKCFIREDDRIYLAKSETLGEIASEVVSHDICRALGLPGTEYIYAVVHGRECSVCEIKTSPSVEMIPCRDILHRLSSEYKAGTAYYDFMMGLDAAGFVKMQIFDYLTLNTDRNRDNFGIRRENGAMKGLYPVFDHDSCFKGRSVDAHYFVTGFSFADSVEYLCDRQTDHMKSMETDIADVLRVFSDDSEKEMFVGLKGQEVYDGLMGRTEDMLCRIQELCVRKQQSTYFSTDDMER